MSRADLTLDRPPTISLPDLLATLAALDVPFRRQGEGIAIRDPQGLLSAELRAALSDHRDAMLVLADLRSELPRLHEYLIRLRCEDPPKGSRNAACLYIAVQIRNSPAAA